MLSFVDRAVVVTGAAGGMGRAIARRFVAEGAIVFAGDVQDCVPPTRSEGRWHPVRLDVTDESDWRAVLAAAETAAGCVTGLVNCAGIVEYRTIEEQDPASFRRVVDVNLYGPWLGMHVLGPSLRRSGGGAIVNISSTQGIAASANLSAYAASKFGVRGLTKSAALEFARSGVRVCSVHPGPTRTEMTAHVTPAQLAAQPLDRFGEPDEIAEMVWFIAAHATYSTGAEFVADGGVLLGQLAPTVSTEDGGGS